MASMVSVGRPCDPMKRNNETLRGCAMDWYLSVLKKYAVFSGRARRKEYWYFTLVNAIIYVALLLLDKMFGLYNAENGTGTLSLVYALAVFLPGLAVGVRRLHDTGRKGWWLLLAFIPLIGALVLIYFMVQDSQAGSNQYGDNPKGVSALINSIGQ